MSDAVVAQKSPYEARLEPGEYWWCACGRSKNQPFCDGSHEGTGIQPVSFQVEQGGTYWMCGCKQSANPPFCDGAHDLLD
jgi:CDGSH-type Zn-finger protein